MPAGALERAVELLGRLGETGPELTVAQLAADAGMPTSTAYRLLAELEQYGLVQRSSDRTVALVATASAASIVKIPTKTASLQSTTRSTSERSL